MAERKAKMSAATKKKLAAYKSGKKKPMSKTALAAKRRKLIAKLPRHKRGPRKGQLKKAR